MLLYQRTVYGCTFKFQKRSRFYHPDVPRITNIIYKTHVEGTWDRLSTFFFIEKKDIDSDVTLLEKLYNILKTESDTEKF